MGESQSKSREERKGKGERLLCSTVRVEERRELGTKETSGVDGGGGNTEKDADALRRSAEKVSE